MTIQELMLISNPTEADRESCRETVNQYMHERYGIPIERLRRLPKTRLAEGIARDMLEEGID